MERAYLNRREGEQRIHIEVDADEIAGLLADLVPDEGRFGSGPVQQLLEILRAADRVFGGVSR